jgi:serine/threonine protein kinase
VFRALDTTSGTSLAVKKSRVSLRIQRTLLHYEAKVLQALSGHPAIPTLFGYGRFSHFEYLGMELGGKSVGDIIKHNEGHGVQLKTVILLALQTVGSFYSRCFVELTCRLLDICASTYPLSWINPSRRQARPHAAFSA